MRTRVLFVGLAMALLVAACGDDSPSADDVAAEAREQTKEAADEVADAAKSGADKAKEVGKDVADGPDKPALTISSPADQATVTGSTVALKVLVAGVTIMKPDGDRSGKTGHFHVFVDRTPLAVGQTIPVEAGIVHSAENPISVTGLQPGKHTLTVVFGDGAHTRIHGDAQAQVTVNVTA